MSTPVFVHSFPSRFARTFDRSAATASAEMLRSFLTNGPLLTPELVEVPPVRGSKWTSETIPLLQRRFCLTLIDPVRIETHMDAFGPVSVAFSHESVMSAGAAPVFYFLPFALTEDQNEFSLALVHNLRQVVKFVQEMRFLRDASREEMNHVLASQVDAYRFGQFRSILERFFELVDCSEERLTMMEGVVQRVGELFYPSSKDAKLTDVDFAYYAEREWRLLADMVINGAPTTQQPSVSIMGKLLEIDPGYFGQMVEFQGQKYLVAHLTRQLTSRARGRLLAGIRHIYCRADVATAVSEVAEEWGYRTTIVGTDGASVDQGVTLPQHSPD